MPYTYTVYTFFASSCTARVRIAAALKGITLTYKFIRLHKGEQHNEIYINEINPSASVPALVVHDEDGTAIAVITQSVAIMEYLDETVSGGVRLLPPAERPLDRAKVRELVGVVVCDVQPVTNMRVCKRVEGLVGEGRWSEDEWQRYWMRLGLEAYERLVKGCAGKYSVGDEVSMADVCLVAAVDRAVRYDVDLGGCEIVRRIDAQVRRLEAYEKGGFRMQPDTFRSLRGGREGRL